MPSTSTKFQLREAGPTCVVLTCATGLSWEYRDVLAEAVERYLRPRPAVTGVVLDMTAVPFVNSAGLGALFQLMGRLRSHERRLVFANVTPLVARMFDAVGLQRLASMARDVPAALAELAPDVPRRRSTRGPRKKTT